MKQILSCFLDFPAETSQLYAVKSTLPNLTNQGEMLEVNRDYIRKHGDDRHGGTAGKRW